MDSFGLRQEQSELLKSVAELKHILEAGEARIKELHVEEMRYLKEIPAYREQAESAEIQAKSAIERKNILIKDMTETEQKLRDIQPLITVQEKALEELKVTQIKIIEETKAMNEQIKQRLFDLKQREENLANSQRLVDSIKEEYKKKDDELDKREVELSRKENEHHIKVEDLFADIDTYQFKVIEHGKKEKALIQAKEFHAQDEQALANKSAKLDKTLKENIELKAALLLQAEKLAEEIKVTQSKQVSLDRAIADLVNQENALKIKELKIKKMAHDAGLVKELAELSK